MKDFFKTFGILFICLGILFSAGAYSIMAEKNPGVDSRPCYTVPSDLGKVVMDLTKRVGELELNLGKQQSCEIYLQRAKKKIEKSRNNIWIGVDGNKIDAVPDITDYLDCMETK